jgi:hypothetical protein
MRNHSGNDDGTEPITTVTIDADEPPADLPANVTAAIARLDKLDEQAAQICRCVERVCATARALLARG